MTTSQTQPSPWVLAGEPTSLGDPTGLITLVDGQTFCLSGRSGDFSTNPTHGVFFADMRVLSQARLLVGGVTVEPLAVSLADASGCTFVGRSIAHHQTDPRILVVRRRQLGSVWHEQIELRNTTASAVSAVVELEVAADFADVFAIKEGRPSSEGEHSLEVKEHSLLFSWRLGDVHRQAELSVEGRRAGVYSWIRVERQHRAAWTCACCNSISLLLSATRGSNAGTIIQTFPTPPIATRVGSPRCRSCGRPIGSSSAAYDRSVEDIGALAVARPDRSPPTRSLLPAHRGT